MSLDSLSSALADRYRIERELGQGGMATVYLADDLRHRRKVAIKVLRPELAAVIGAERFLAEITTTANLQHPHILPLFDSGQVDGTVYYAMPFVEGESLRDRLAREKQLPLADAVRVASEVAGALDYAHRHGVIHRDIKPENILLHDGSALVADFGIALAATSAGSRMTETGMSLGTPHYMSPEQAMGERSLDARADVYALGCVLYEMLVGEPPFTGPTAQAIVAKVMTEKPAPIRSRRDRVPEHVEDAVLTALEKLPADRFATAAEFIAAIGAEGTGRTTARTRTQPAAAGGVARHWRTATAALAAVSMALGAIVVLDPRREPAPRPVRFEVQTADAPGSLMTVIAGAPDGSSYAYCSSSGAILLRRWDDLVPTPLSGPLRGCVTAVYSPDGRSIAMIGLPTRLHVFSATGESPRRELDVEGLADLGTYGGGIDWAADGRLYVAGGREVRWISPADGRSGRITPPDSPVAFYGIDVLPGERHAIVVTAATVGANAGDAQVAILDLRTGTTASITTGVAARYVHPGRLLVVRSDGSMMLAPFDPRSQAVTGGMAVLPDSVGAFRIGGHWHGLIDVAADGTLYYVRLRYGGGVQPVLVDRNGMDAPVDAQWREELLLPRLSPDGARIAAELGGAVGASVIVRDRRTGASRRLTSGLFSGRVTWRPDGSALTLISDADGAPRPHEWRMDSDVATPMRRYDPRPMYGVEWSRDGRWLVLRTDDQVAGRGDILAVRPGTDTVATPVVADPQVSEYAPALSPDARWLAYVSNEGDRFEVRVTDFPAGRLRWQVSQAGGTEPAWSPDGRELFYLADGHLIAAAVAPGPEFRVESQRRLLPMAPYVTFGIWARNYDLTPDGKHFLMLRHDGRALSSVAVVQHWVAGLGTPVGGR